MSTKVMSIAQIVAKTGMSRVYVHRALTKGWLAGTKVVMADSKVEQWVVTEEQYNTWRKRVESHKASKTSFTGNDKQVSDLAQYMSTLKEQDKRALLKSMGIDLA